MMQILKPNRDNLNTSLSIGLPLIVLGFIDFFGNTSKHNVVTFYFTFFVSHTKIKMLVFKLFIVFSSLFLTTHLFAQQVELILKPNIQSIRFHTYGNQQGLPIYQLNSSNQLELRFDDMDANVKNYYYTLQLCDYNWYRVNISPFNYLKALLNSV